MNRTVFHISDRLYFFYVPVNGRTVDPYGNVIFDGSGKIITNQMKSGSIYQQIRG